MNGKTNSLKVIGIGVLVFGLLVVGVFGQSTHKVSQGISSNNLAPGSPTGSYALSDFESIKFSYHNIIGIHKTLNINKQCTVVLDFFFHLSHAGIDLHLPFID